MAKVGAPTKYKPEYAAMVEKMAACGLTDDQMAEVLGVAMSTFSLWKVKHPEFSEANARGKPGVDEQVRQSLLKRALGGFTVKEVTRDQNGNVIKTVEREVPADTTATLRWLFNRVPSEWRERRDEAPPANVPPMNIHISGKPNPEDLGTEKNDNLEISKGKQ
jgi:hypothetical protein